MVKAIYLSLICILLTSCSSTYFFTTLDTMSGYIDKVDNGDFLFENDSLWIAYCFEGENAPIQITVFNKIDKPLYIDWRRSALIVDNVAYTYAGEKMNFTGYTNTISTNYDLSYNEIQGYINGVANLPKSVSFIPPQTMTSHRFLRFTNLSFQHIKDKDYSKMSMQNKHADWVDAKSINFSNENTPLKFNSYVTIFAKEDQPMVFNQDFYVSNIIKTSSISPRNLPNHMQERGDLFYIEKPANTAALDVILGTTLAVGIIAIDIAIEKSSDRY